MNTEQGFTLHPGAAQDITDIWEFILEDNPLAAQRGRLSLKMDAGRDLQLDPRLHPHLDHGYAVTSHSSQGGKPQTAC